MLCLHTKSTTAKIDAEGNTDVMNEVYGMENAIVAEGSEERNSLSDDPRKQEAEWCIIADVVDKIVFILNTVLLILSLVFVFPRPPAE